MRSAVYKSHLCRTMQALNKGTLHGEAVWAKGVGFRVW